MTQSCCHGPSTKMAFPLSVKSDAPCKVWRGNKKAVQVPQSFLGQAWASLTLAQPYCNVCVYACLDRPLTRNFYDHRQFCSFRTQDYYYMGCLLVILQVHLLLPEASCGRPWWSGSFCGEEDDLPEPPVPHPGYCVNARENTQCELHLVT